MKKNEFYVKVVFNGEEYTFQNGSEAYIFHAGILNEFYSKRSIKELLTYTSFVWDVYVTDGNHTQLGALADYIAKHWDEVKGKSDGTIIRMFYDFAEQEENK